MAEVIHDDKLLTYFFQDSLTGSTLSWYIRLDNVRIKKWIDLADAFLKQYKFNLEIAPDRTSLITMEKGTQEFVRAYAQRWRDQAVNVQPPLIETEMVTLFANTFGPHTTNILWVAQPSISIMLCELLKGLSKESEVGELRNL